MSSFKHSGSCFSKDGGPREDVKIRVGEELKTFAAVKMMFSDKTVSSGKKNESVVEPMMAFGVKT